jgi:hypothetical protein
MVTRQTQLDSAYCGRRTWELVLTMQERDWTL